MSDPENMDSPYDIAHIEEQREKETCMCGMLMEDHTIGDGHSPVSMWDYYSKRSG